MLSSSLSEASPVPARTSSSPTGSNNWQQRHFGVSEHCHTD